MRDSKISSSAEIYTNFEGLANLRREAGENDPEAIDKVARQFEGIFVQMMMKSMRDTVPDGGLFRKDGMEFYQDMHDKQLSLHLSEGNGLGLREMIVKQLTQGTQAETTGEDSAEGVGVQAYLNSPIRSNTPLREMIIRQQGSEVSLETHGKAASTSDSVITTKDDFFEKLWPSAQKAGEALGVDPQLLMAQAALESGWGRSTLASAESENSHNLFGIKSSRQWQGDSVSVDTLEYQGGLPEKQKASFRAYESYEESFNDYVNFINQNPRYASALENASDAEKYINELQNAGYATDPNYANKVMSIYRQIQNTLSTVSDSTLSDSQRTVLSNELEDRGDVDV